MAEITRAEVIKILGSGGPFGEGNLAGVDLSELDLSGLDFSNANCLGARFDRANLRGARFVSARLQNASFVGADLQNATLSRALLTSANLSNAIIVGASLEDANCEKINFTGVTADKSTNMKGANRRNVVGEEYLNVVQSGMSGQQTSNLVYDIFQVIGIILQAIGAIVGAIIRAMFGR